MFKGFDIPLPQYEVITPQSNLSFTVKSMNVRDEENLKTALLTPSRVTDHLNRSIFNLIVEKPNEIKDFKTFERSITPRDREALLFGIYHTSYGDIRNYDINCLSCDKTYPINIDISKTFNILVWPQENGNILEKKVTFKLEIFKDVSVTVRQPTLADEISALEVFGKAKHGDAIADTVCIENFTREYKPTQKGEKKPLIYTERVDIVDGFFTLPPKDRKFIVDKYEENFGKYRIDLKMKSTCPFCGEEQDTNIDIVQQFFRMVFAAA
jgi:hypothetical protein